MVEDNYKRHTDNYFMDMENDVLAAGGCKYMDKRRVDDDVWMTKVRANMDTSPERLEARIAEYVEWVKDGGGDEWFQDGFQA